MKKRKVIEKRTSGFCHPDFTAREIFRSVGINRYLVPTRKVTSTLAGYQTALLARDPTMTSPWC